MAGHADCLGALDDCPRGWVVAGGFGGVFEAADVVGCCFGVYAGDAGCCACPAAYLEECCAPGWGEVADDCARVVGFGDGGQGRGEED